MYYFSINGPYGKKEIIPTETIKKLLRKKFETIFVNIPENYNDILCRIYGNYMELPPNEKRVHKHNTEYFWI